MSNIQMFILRKTCTFSFMVFLSCIHVSSLVDGRMNIKHIVHGHQSRQEIIWTPLSTGALNNCLRRVTIPDAVTIQFDLLKMNMLLLETYRGL